MRGFDVADFAAALTNQFLIVGVFVTAGLTVAGLAGGLVLGLVVALLRASSRKAISRSDSSFTRTGGQSFSGSSSDSRAGSQ